MFESKKTKQAIKLRPVSNGGNARRLGLYTAEFKQYVKDQIVNALFIDLGSVLLQVPSLKTYFHGSITSPDINVWLHQHGWLTADHHLLFSLDVDESRHTHTYRFVEHV